jgi:iron complex outermembrane receptor protein
MKVSLSRDRAIMGRNALMAMLLLGGAGVVAVSPALAEQGDSAADAQASGDAQDIVVTAQFRSQRVQDTPLSITALDADLLESRGVSNFTQVGEQAPNVVIKPAGSVYGPAAQVFIRGIGQGDTNFALEPGVGVYIDDVYYATVFGSIFDMVDLDRVEILRGPQGTLAGKNSIGGTIKLFSARPNNDFGGYLEGTVGSFDRVGLRGSINVPIIKDKLAVRVAGVAQRSTGYVTSYDYACLHPGSGVPSSQTNANSCVIGHEGGQDYYGLRGTLLWTPTPDVDVTIIADRTVDRSEPAATVLTALESRGRAFLNGVPFDSKFVTGGTYINYATYANPGGVYSPTLTLPATSYALDRYNNLKEWGLSGRVEARLAENLSLTAISAFRQYHGQFSSDADETPFNFQLVFNDFQHRQFTQEVRLSGTSFTNALDWTVGGFFFKSKDVTGGRVFFPTNFDTLLDDPVDSRSLSGFAHATLHLTDRLNITGGLRYSDEEKTYIYNREDPNTGRPPPPLAAIDGVGATFKGNRFDYKINIDFHPTDDVMLYGQISTGFRSGGINPRPFWSNQVVPFNPETLTAYELGFKSQFADRRITLNGALFLNKYNDILIGTNTRYVNPNMPINNDPTSPGYNPAAGTFPSAVVINGGKADLKGFELETVLRPVSGLSIDASLSYLQFKFSSLSAAALASGLTLNTQRPFTPEWKWNIGVQYEGHLGDLGTLTPRFDISFQDNMFTSATQNVHSSLNSYTLANARLTWRGSDKLTTVSLAVSNLFDKYYYLNKFETFNISGIALGQPGRPREWRLTLKREF